MLRLRYSQSRTGPGGYVRLLTVEQIQATMESCPGKTVMSGVMGFALGGAFGLFMSSVRQCSFLSLHHSQSRSSRLISLPFTPVDELRYLDDDGQPSYREPPIARTAPPRLQGYGQPQFQLREEFRPRGIYLRRDGVLYRGLPGEERHDECHCCRVYYRRCVGGQGRPAGCGDWVRRLCSVQHGDRNVVEDAE